MYVFLIQSLLARFMHHCYYDQWSLSSITIINHDYPGVNRLHNYGKSPCSMGNSLQLAMFTSYVELPQGIYCQVNQFYDPSVSSIAIYGQS